MGNGNTLMFEVAVSDSVKQLDKIKQELDKFSTDYASKLKLKVEIDNLNSLTQALSQIGDNQNLRNLRAEITELNKQFIQLSKGAGGVGDINARGLSQSAEKAKQDWEDAVKNLERYRKQYDDLKVQRSSAPNATVAASYDKQMSEMQLKMDGATSKADRLRVSYEQLAKEAANANQTAAKSTKEWEAEIAKLKAQIDGLRANPVNVNIGGEFKTWAEQVQTLVAQVKELVAEFQKLRQVQGQSNAASSVKSQANEVKQEVSQFTELDRVIRGLEIEVGKLVSAFSKLSSADGLTNLQLHFDAINTAISQLATTLSTLSNAIKLQPIDEQVKALLERAETAEKKLKEVGDAARYLNERAGERTQQKATTIAGIAGVEEEKVEKVSNLLERYLKLLADVQNQSASLGKVQNVAEQLGINPAVLERASKSFEQLWKIIENSISGKEVHKGFPVLDMTSDQLTRMRSEFSALKSEYRQVTQEADRYNKTTERESAKADANIRKLGMAFNELKNYMKANGGSEEMRKLQAEIQVAIQKMRQLMNTGNFAEAVNVYERMVGSLRQAATATKEFENSQHSLSSTISHTNSNLQGQSQILSDLKTMAMQYLSVWGAQSFINNIIELGGQLEQQRLSIGAILQDTAQANHLFSQIKDLAIKSPFGVQQLDAMTKQLSAYGFQYSELFDMTKRLADISAATGTSVDRLALALGHVRSEGALSGYTLRQFSMGNIPLLRMLSENLGKTTQEIRKMTRNKEIGYEEVLNVLKQLTDEGGMFYEAQETMSEALNAKFKNLRDSFQIMYSEMAEGAPGDFLKGVATVLTDISRSWRILMPMVMSGAAGFALMKGATMALNYQLEREGRLLAGNAIATSKYSISQLRAIATTGKWTLALRGLGAALMSIGKFIFNPVTLGFAAVEGLIYLWSKHNDEVRRAKELTKALGDEAAESEKNISKQLENISPYKNGMDDSAMKTAVDSMTETIKNYAVNGQKVINEMFGSESGQKVMSLAEKYQYLRGELEKTIEVYRELKKVADAFEYGMTTSDGGWFDDNVETDLTQYSEAYKAFIDAVTEYSSKYGNSIETAIKAAEKADPVFAKATENMASYGEKLAEFWSNPEKYEAAAKAMNNLYGAGAGTNDAASLNESFFGYQNAKTEAMRELDDFMKNTEDRLKEKGYDFSKELAPQQVGALIKESKDWLEKHPEWGNIYDVIREKLENRWKIKIEPDVEAVEEKLPQWLEDFQKELDKTGIKLTATMSMEQIIDEMKKAYDKAQTTINKLGPIAMKANIDFVGMTDEFVEKFKYLNPEMYETLKQLKGAQDSKAQIDAAGNKRGLNFKGMRKDGTHKAERQNTEAAKAVRERVRVIREAADAFQYWRDKVGDKGAWEHVKSEFGDVLNKIGITANNIEDVRAHLQNIPKMKEYKAITDKKVKTEIDKEISKENDQYIRKDFEKSTEEFLSRTQNELDNLTRAWEIFNNVRNATGNIELAVQISGADYANGQTRNLADALRQKIEEDLSASGAALSLDVTLSDKDIEEQVKKAMPKEGETRIKGIVEEYQKWRNLQRDVLKGDIDVFDSIIGSAVDYESQLKKIKDSYDIRKASLDAGLANGTIKQGDYNQATGMLDAETEAKRWQASQSYIDLMNNSLAMTKDEIEAAAQTQEDSLNRQLEAGLITIKQYSDEMAKLRGITSNYRLETTGRYSNRFTAFMTGGGEGLQEYYKRRANQYWTAYDNATYKDSPEAQEALKQAKHYDDLSEKQKKAADTAQDMTDSLGKMKGAVDMLTQFLEAAGGGDETLSGFGDMLGGAMNGASAGAAFGPYGAAIGGALGAVTSIMQMSDKEAQKTIEALKENSKAIEANTAMIETNRERTLGYDTGDLRRRLLQLEKNRWNNGDYKIDFGLSFMKPIDDPVGEAMQDFYSRNADKSGYQQQLEDLKEQKQIYQSMYTTEESKKNASGEALTEYKQKIAELEDEIMFFTEDLAKELWGIDFKSWADQISDALWTAFENGEDAVKAFRDTANDIIADVAKKMMNIHFIEPAFKELETQLFGGVDSNGNVVKGAAYNEDTGTWNEDETLRILGKFFGEDGEFAKVINNSEAFYKMAERVAGVDFSSNGESSMSGTIKGITEQTADLLASYVNAIRADVSVNRQMIAQYFPMYYEVLTNGSTSLRNIENHTAAIMRSNDAIERSNQAILDNFNGLKNKAWRVPMA